MINNLAIALLQHLAWQAKMQQHPKYFFYDAKVTIIL